MMKVVFGFPLFGLLLVVSAFSAPAFAAELTGTWTLSIDTPRGVQNPTLEVVNNDGVYSGTYNSIRGPLPIEQITIAGETFEFPLVITVPIGEISVLYKGRIEGDAMSGLVQNPRGEVPFTGVRN